MLVLQPLLAYENPAHRVVFGAILILIFGLLLATVLDGGRERMIGIALAAPAVAASFAHNILLGADQPLAITVVYHLSLAAFLAYALACVLRHVFRTRGLTADDVAGALSGYLLTGLCWAHLYNLAWLLAPSSLDIQPEIRWQLVDWNSRHALFDYFSFATLASIGYGDITTTSPVTNTLAWMEVIFGQFYLAVVVASIVSMKLSQVAAPASADYDK